MHANNAKVTMGISGSQMQRSRKTSSSSFRRQTSEITEVTKKIDQKECVFIAMQGEIDKAITEHNSQSMKNLASEIAAHIMDLNQLKQMDIPTSERGRTQKVIYNFEISLAKLKSILSSDTVSAKRIRSQSPQTSQFYTSVVDPDLVSDLIRFDNIDRPSYSQNRSTLPALPEDSKVVVSNSSVARNNSLYSKQAQSAEEVVNSVESEFGVIQDQLQRPIEEVVEYYQMDKGIFYLLVRLKNTEVPQGSTLNDKKYRLVKELTEFRSLLDRKSGELEEHRDLIQQISALELLIDSATGRELEGLKRRVLKLQQTLENSINFGPQGSKASKLELLRRLADILQTIAYSCSPATSLRHSVEHLYGNVNAMQEELNKLKAQEELESLEAIDRVLEEQPEYTEDIENDNDEAIYGNIEIIRQNVDNNNVVKPRVQRNNSSKDTQRGTVYVNAEIVRQNNPFQENSFSTDNTEKNQEMITKRPLPLPRNYDDKIINDLPKHWQRLNEILDSKQLSDTDKLEVVEILKHAELAKNLFERKIKSIVEKSEECIDL